MKYDLELIIFDIKHRKIIYLIPVLFVLLIFFPFMKNQAENIILTGGDPFIYFQYFQKTFPLLMIYYLYLFFRNFLDNESMEAINVMNMKNKFILIIYILCFFQIILIPFYVQIGRAHV